MLWLVSLPEELVIPATQVLGVVAIFTELRSPVPWRTSDFAGQWPCEWHLDRQATYLHARVAIRASSSRSSGARSRFGGAAESSNTPAAAIRAASGTSCAAQAPPVADSERDQSTLLACSHREPSMPICSRLVSAKLRSVSAPSEWLGSSNGASNKTGASEKNAGSCGSAASSSANTSPSRSLPSARLAGSSESSSVLSDNKNSRS
mmetsp:Transcript_16462/g.45884  ORF Transcript_16462/g.45884 Transcript_16462/m.45884 type:complete len:206 (+) Transcript_16462:159-776(+)